MGAGKWPTLIPRHCPGREEAHFGVLHILSEDIAPASPRYRMPFFARQDDKVYTQFFH